MTFGDSVAVERLTVPPAMVSELESRLVLCYTGKPRLSGNIHENVWGAFRRGATSTVNALYTLRDCAVQMRAALLNGDSEAFGNLLSRNWENQKALDPSITNPQIEDLFERAGAAGSVGGKACGAGGGGCLLFFATAGKRDAVVETLAQAGTRIIPFQFDFEGLQVTKA
jgi:D-glycero-alpha-D-manno-heptose-7-phosphate kinase